MNDNTEGAVCIDESDVTGNTLERARAARPIRLLCCGATLMQLRLSDALASAAAPCSGGGCWAVRSLTRAPGLSADAARGPGGDPRGHGAAGDAPQDTVRAAVLRPVKSRGRDLYMLMY